MLGPLSLLLTCQVADVLGAGVLASAFVPHGTVKDGISLDGEVAAGLFVLGLLPCTGRILIF